jgi:hypothetical protein
MSRRTFKMLNEPRASERQWHAKNIKTAFAFCSFAYIAARITRVGVSRPSNYVCEKRRGSGGWHLKAASKVVFNGHFAFRFSLFSLTRLTMRCTHAFGALNNSDIRSEAEFLVPQCSPFAFYARSKQSLTSVRPMLLRHCIMHTCGSSVIIIGLVVTFHYLFLCKARLIHRAPSPVIVTQRSE